MVYRLKQLLAFAVSLSLTFYTPVWANPSASEQAMQMYQPSPTQYQEIMQWFEHYDQLSKNHEIEKMADQGVFPMFLITDNAKGEGVTRVWSRADFIHNMKLAMENAPTDLPQAKRTPYMVSEHLAIVFSEWNINGQTQKYVDFLMKQSGQWKFQTMMQGGWGDFLSPS